MKRRPSRWSVLLTFLVLAIVGWRVPALRRSATHRSEIAQLLQQPVPAVFGSLDSLTGAAPIPTLYYLYSEGCPYCGMDRAKVREVAITSHVEFVGLRVGPSLEGDHYWKTTGLPMPDAVFEVGWSELERLGVDGVPVVFVAARDTLRAAWIGHLRWDIDDLRRGVRCRLGAKASCATLYLSDLGHAFRDRASVLTGGSRSPNTEALTVPSDAIE